MIGWERLEDLRREKGQKDFAGVARLFFEKIDCSLLVSLDITDPDEICDLLHFIRGSALNLRFFEPARLCEPDFFCVGNKLICRKNSALFRTFASLLRTLQLGRFSEYRIVGSSLNDKLRQRFIICYVRITIAGSLKASKKSFKTIGVFGFQSDQD